MKIAAQERPGWRLCTGATSSITIRHWDNWYVIALALEQASAEGLLARLNWRNMQVDDGYLISEGVFTDPDGFLREAGGITGVTHREDLAFTLKPRYRFDVMIASRPILLLSLSARVGTPVVPAIGVAWRKADWLPHLRYYPTQRRLEVGATGRGWQVRLSADNLPHALRTGEVAVSVAPVKF